MPGSTDKENNYFHKLVEKSFGPKQIISQYYVVSNLTKTDNPGNLKDILGLQMGHLSQTAIETLNLLEEEKEQELSTDWITFKWQVLAFLTVQDIFDSPLFRAKEKNSLFHQWYFYYESKYILFEAILCGLNGFLSSIGPLMRLFLEFNSLQNYFYRKVRENSSYSILEKYFENKFNPSWNTILQNSMSTDSFCKPIRKLLDIHLKSLSTASVHPYQPFYSQRQESPTIPEQTLVGTFFFMKLSFILKSVLWLYFVNFPMLFHPLNLSSKFGFNYPAGIFIDEQGGEIIKRSVSPSDYCHFLEYSKKSNVYRDTMDFYNSQTTLKEEEIVKSWQLSKKNPFKSTLESHSMIMAEMRVIKEAMSLNLSKKDDSEGVEYEKLRKILDFDKWRNFYKKVK